MLVIDPVIEPQELRTQLEESLSNGKLNVIIVRRPCLLAVGKIRQIQADSEKKV